jgi:hypothetical protein
VEFGHAIANVEHETLKDEQVDSLTTRTIDSSEMTLPTKKSAVNESNKPSVKVATPSLPPPLPHTYITADTLSDVKRRREERRRGVGASPLTAPVSSIVSSTQLHNMTENNDNNNNHLNEKPSNGTNANVVNEPLQRYTSPKHIDIKDYHLADVDREKRICCTIL